jgi:hypothetical protein
MRKKFLYNRNKENKENKGNKEKYIKNFLYLTV